MAARLTLSDFDDPDFGWIDLCEERASHRAFWAAVLQFAFADGADSVVYDLDRDESCLIIQTSKENYCMEPPPSEYRDELLSAMIQWSGGRFLRAWIKRIPAALQGSTYVGNVVLETRGGDVSWHVHRLRHGVRIDRVASSNEELAATNEDGDRT